jgi:anti-sigma B factor antagonist
MGIHIIVPDGEMVSGEGDLELRDELTRLIEAGHFRIAVDFSSVPYIDSSVLGQLVHGYAQLKQLGGTLKITSPSKRIRGLLELTRLITIFEVFSSREELLNSW